MSRKQRPSPLVATALVGLAVGLAGTLLATADPAALRGVRPIRVTEIARLEPVRVLPRAELTLVAIEAREYLEAGRPWTAWRLLRDNLTDVDEAPAGAVLMAARSAGGWGGWRQARDLLAGRTWLDRAEGGEGRLLLARAEEELGDEEAAIAEYRRYLALPDGASGGIAQAHLGRLLAGEGDERGAAAAFAAAGAALPEVADWMHALRLEQLARAGDRSVAAVAALAPGGSPPVRLRRVLAEAAAAVDAGDEGRALRRLEWEAGVLRVQGARAEAAAAELERARILLDEDDDPAARALLRAIATEGAAPTPTRLAAAQLLGELDGRTAAEETARADGYAAAGKPGLAARALRGAIAAGLDDGAVRLRIARLLYDERDFGPARAAFLDAAGHLSGEARAEAELYAARSLYRGAKRDRPKALAEIRRVAERHPGTPAAGTALFLLGDEASTLRAAVSYYRRAAAVRGSPDAREALYRVGDRSVRLKDPAGAVRAWEEYVERYPRGEQTARVAYETARIHARAGRASRARAMYAAAMLADPLSYYAMRAGDRTDADPLDPILSEPRPWAGLASDPMEVHNVLRRVDTLEELGLGDEADAELAAATRAFDERPAALLLLAEGLAERGRAVEGVRIGYRLQERRGEWDVRLLRLVFPFPFREILLREARRADVDPDLLAGLVRQESTFRPAVRSHAGATGLGQIMPATGRWLAPAVGIRRWEDRLLRVPEVNLRMSARYIGDLLERYDGAADLALAGYNAGPGRADRWRRQIGRSDVDAFRERIPFDETREYVKIVLRNAEVYGRLYGD